MDSIINSITAYKIKFITVFLCLLAVLMLALIGAWQQTIPPRFDRTCHLVQVQSWQGTYGTENCKSCH